MEILPKQQSNNQTTGLAEEAKTAMAGGKPFVPADKMKFSPPVKGGGLKLPPLKQIGKGLQEAKWPIVLSVIIIGLVFLAWGGFFFYHKSLLNKKDDLERRAESLNNAENREATQKVLNLESGLKEIKGLLGAHIFPSEAFKLLEDNILTGVRLLDFKLDARTSDIAASGLAQTYSTLAKQLLILENLDIVKEVKISGVSLNQLGGVGFQLNIILNKDFFKK
jgi:hypothetical protein